MMLNIISTVSVALVMASSASAALAVRAAPSPTKYVGARSEDSCSRPGNGSSTVPANGTSSFPTSTIPGGTSSTTPSGTSTGGGDPSETHTDGFATFFFQNGVAGACGTVHQDSDLICAMDSAIYSASLCGSQVVITNTDNQQTVTVTIADECPTCDNADSIDLSQGAFDKIADESTGIVPISWHYA